jgi:hypothetical protein
MENGKLNKTNEVFFMFSKQMIKIVDFMKQSYIRFFRTKMRQTAYKLS